MGLQALYRCSGSLLLCWILISAFGRMSQSGAHARPYQQEDGAGRLVFSPARKASNVDAAAAAALSGFRKFKRIMLVPPELLGFVYAGESAPGVAESRGGSQLYLGQGHAKRGAYSFTSPLFAFFDKDGKEQDKNGNNDALLSQLGRR